MFIYISAVTEVLFHSCMTTLLLGWDWGFMIYAIVMIPISFYLAYTLPNHEGGIVSPMVSSGVVILCFNVVHAICRHTTGFYEGKYPVNMSVAFYYFNATVAFLILLTFSILFALEIRYMQRRLEQENDTLEEVAKTDPLTHLLNRRSMNGYMDQVVKQRKTFCLMMADIDDFKKVNDTYGHDCGDLVLRQVADILRRHMRGNGFAARWGGEEFLLVFENLDLEGAKKLLNEILDDIRSMKCRYDDLCVTVTMTFGLTQGNTDNVTELLRTADERLYKGKNSGKNQVV